MKQTLIPAKDTLEAFVPEIDRVSMHWDRLVAALPSAAPKTVRRLKKETAAVLERYRKSYQSWVPVYIEKAMKEGELAAVQNLERIGRKRKRNYVRTRSMHGAMMKKYDFAFREIKKSFGGLYKTKETWLDSGVVPKSILATRKPTDIMEIRTGGGIKELDAYINTPLDRRTKDGRLYTGKPNLQETKMKVQEIWEKKYGELDKISVPSRTRPGKFRNYDFKKYKDLVARSEGTRVRTENVLRYCRDYGNDLFFVPRHFNPCPICEPFEGQVFSISGKHPLYPSMASIGLTIPAHTNCEHSIQPISDIQIQVLSEADSSFISNTVDHATTLKGRKFELTKAGRKRGPVPRETVFDPITGKTHIFRRGQKREMAKLRNQTARHAEFTRNTDDSTLGDLATQLSSERKKWSVRQITQELNRFILGEWTRNKLPYRDKFGYLFGYVDKHILTQKQVRGLLGDG